MIPDYIANIIKILEDNKYEAYIVGGSVRDLLMGRTVKDWDLTTNARPEAMLKILPDARYENVFGTVIVPIKNDNGENIDAVEVTTYRSEQGYSDRRHPDEIQFEDSIEKDLERRDFTVNALALRELRIKNYELRMHESKIILDKRDYLLIDMFGGQKDIAKKIIRAVGEPEDRFKEDALRMMRTARFCCQLGFELEPKTARGIMKLAGSLKFIAGERIQAELVKILASTKPYEGVKTLHELKLLNYIIPELSQGEGMKQVGHHIYDVFDHSLLALKHCPSSEWQVRLAALLHDIAKPKTMKILNGKPTFYNHDFVGAKMARKIMERLKFSAADTERVVNLVKNHMFYYNTGEVTAASVRRLIAKVGRANLHDLIDLRVGDRLGSGTPKAMPYKLRHLQYMFERVQNDPVSVKMLKINGDDLMELLKIEPGPKIGAILDCLLAEVLTDPKLNTKEWLTGKARELDKMNLEELRAKAKEVIAGKQQEDDQEMKKDFHV